MKRSLIFALLVSAAVVAVTSLASAVPIEQRGNPEAVSSNVSPRTDRSRPYTFRTRGSLTLPTRFCAPGATPGPSGSASNCVPLNCPAGATNPFYCTRPTLADVCSGEVRIRFRRGLRTYSSRRVDLDADCDYSSTARINNRRLRRSELRVTVAFLGNDYLVGKAASAKFVTAGR